MERSVLSKLTKRLSSEALLEKKAQVGKFKKGDSVVPNEPIDELVPEKTYTVVDVKEDPKEDIIKVDGSNRYYSEWGFSRPYGVSIMANRKSQLKEGDLEVGKTYSWDEIIASGHDVDQGDGHPYPVGSKVTIWNGPDKVYVAQHVGDDNFKILKKVAKNITPRVTSQYRYQDGLPKDSISDRIAQKLVKKADGPWSDFIDEEIVKFAKIYGEENAIKIYGADEVYRCLKNAYKSDPESFKHKEGQVKPYDKYKGAGWEAVAQVVKDQGRKIAEKIYGKERVDSAMSEYLNNSRVKEGQVKQDPNAKDYKKYDGISGFVEKPTPFEKQVRKLIKPAYAYYDKMKIVPDSEDIAEWIAQNLESRHDVPVTDEEYGSILNIVMFGKAKTAQHSEGLDIPKGRSVEKIIEDIKSGADDAFGYSHFDVSNMADYSLMSNTIQDMVDCYGISHEDGVTIVQALTHDEMEKVTKKEKFDTKGYKTIDDYVNGQKIAQELPESKPFYPSDMIDNKEMPEYALSLDEAAEKLNDLIDKAKQGNKNAIRKLVAIFNTSWNLIEKRVAHLSDENLKAWWEQGVKDYADMLTEKEVEGGIAQKIAKRIAQIDQEKYDSYKVGEKIIVEPASYWLHESVDAEKYGQAFEITEPTEFVVKGKQGSNLILENVVPINSEVSPMNSSRSDINKAAIFGKGEMRLYYPVWSKTAQQARKVKVSLKENSEKGTWEVWTGGKFYTSYSGKSAKEDALFCANQLCERRENYKRAQHPLPGTGNSVADGELPDEPEYEKCSKCNGLGCVACDGTGMVIKQPPVNIYEEGEY
jgi:hypothetical protein